MRLLATLGTWLLVVACAPLGAQQPAEPASTLFDPRWELAPATASNARPPAEAPHDDAIVRVVVGDVSCTGTLIHEQLVLTAHHCVARRGADGAYLAVDVPAEAVRVEVGGDDLPWEERGVRHLVAPPCGFAAGVGDIAVLVLDVPLRGVVPREIELDEPPGVGVRVGPIGFGRCAASAAGIRRSARAGGEITQVSETRFQLDAAICPGDSGAPALDDHSGRVYGVLSASVMDGVSLKKARTEFTRVDSWRPVFAAARLLAVGANPAELPPLDCPRQ